MRENLKEALQATRQFLLKAKAGKYNEQKADDKPSVTPQADSGDNGSSDQPQGNREHGGDSSEFETEKVEFFRKKRKPKIGHERVIGFGGQ